MTVALHPPIADMARALSRAALFDGTDLGDEREAHDVLQRAFPHADIESGFEAALEEARAKAQQNARLHDAAEGRHDGWSLIAWAGVLAAVFALCNPLPACAAAAATGGAFDLVERLVPVVLGLGLIVWAIKHVALLGRPPAIAAESDADEIHRHNGESR